MARDTSIMRAPDASRGRSAKLTTTTLTLSVESQPPIRMTLMSQPMAANTHAGPPGTLDPTEEEDLDNGA